MGYGFGCLGNKIAKLVSHTHLVFKSVWTARVEESGGADIGYLLARLYSSVQCRVE
ncbi:hypothetical protein LguiA_014851 [Lonicera macranthoides]